jgi:hypothetical protein
LKEIHTAEPVQADSLIEFSFAKFIAVYERLKLQPGKICIISITKGIKLNKLKNKGS